MEAHRVIAGSSLSQAVRALALTVPLSLCFLTGCAEGPLEGYPSSLRYAERTDPLVLKSPETTPFTSYPPGTLAERVAQLDRVGGKTLDPTGNLIDGKTDREFEEESKSLDQEALKIARERRRQVRDALAKGRDELKKRLRYNFGTPSTPRVLYNKDTSEELATLKEALGLTPENLKKGSALYRRHCLHCHGVNGDGRGPTGPWIDPHPRDYRRGVFKFTSTNNNLKYRKPRRDDLVRTLEKGIEGTSMPAFGLLPAAEIDALVGYLIHLSIRGEVEYMTLSEFRDGNPTFKDPNEDVDRNLELPEYVTSLTEELIKRWNLASTTAPNTIPPPAPAQLDPKTGKAPHDSIVRGYKKFIEAAGDAACLNCHADFGRQSLFRYDVWGTLARPANLTVPIYRGGRRPLDLYYRVSGGIEGCGMPANKTLTPEQFWDLVNFVQALPYPAMLPEEIRKQIYVPHPPQGTEHALGGH
jgi:mono/diheme cytochrome c family protein